MATDVDVSHVVVTGEPLAVLEAQSRAAELVVVGSRGMGGSVGLLVGSTAVHLAAHGRCPVLVVCEQSYADGPVVLGVDGSAARGVGGGIRLRGGRRAERAVGGAARVDHETSTSAQLAVVGARGRGGFAELLLGSVSQALLHHAHCPVAVVRGAGERH
ncbi:hypothetical protein GCM10010252_76970 [Streptomyces aureoverticillatus]|nr:hypothetical protein GCM10010252_76970 [Streptomyces aureoverticillatus]